MKKIARFRSLHMLVIIFAAALAAGCIDQLPGIGAAADLAVTVTADPPQIRPGEPMALFIDVENTGQLDIKNIKIDVFDTGPLMVVKPLFCKKSFEELRPAQLESFECTLEVAQPERLIAPITSASIAIKTTFEKSIRGTFVVDMLTVEELRRLERIGGLEPKPAALTFGDSQLQATLQFNRQPPFAAGDIVAAQLRVRNIGPGYIGKLEPQQFTIGQQDPTRRTFSCLFEAPIYSSNGIFPPITCIFTTPREIPTPPEQEIPTAATYPITLTLNYEYELRQSVPVTILKP